MTPSSPVTPRAAPRRILEDASGRRLRRMRWVGRVVGLVFLVWLALVFLGGIGVGPVARLPFGKLLRPTVGPPRLTTPLRPRPTPAADLTPAVAARPATVARAAATPRARARRAHGRSTAPGRTRTATTARGKSATAPGQARKTSTTTPVTHGASGSAAGHATTTTTTPVVHGKSRRSTTTP